MVQSKNLTVYDVTQFSKPFTQIHRFPIRIDLISLNLKTKCQLFRDIIQAQLYNMLTLCFRAVFIKALACYCALTTFQLTVFYLNAFLGNVLRCERYCMSR